MMLGEHYKDMTKRLDADFYGEIVEMYDKKGFEIDWIKKNSIVLTTAANNEMAIAGSLAVGVATQNPTKLPSDIDFVCDSVSEAMKFISSLAEFLEDKNVFYTIRSNNNNDYMAPFATNHFRLFCPFWKEICVMVIPKVDYFYWRGLKIQNYSQVHEAMVAIEEKSPKGRLDYLLEDLMSGNGDSHEHQDVEPFSIKHQDMMVQKSPEGKTYAKLK